MAHNLEIRNGIASFAENTKKHLAWHGLGQHFDGEMDVKTALELSRANYTVEEIPAGWMNKDGIWVKDEAHKYTQRTDNGEVLGLVSADYGIVQNSDAFDFVDNLCTGKSGEPFIESAGVLGKGERVFVTAKFPEKFRAGDVLGDDGEMYAVITTSHDGSGAVTVVMTPVRVVCNNTLSYAMYNNKSMLRFKHTINVKSRMKDNILHSAQILGVYDATLKAIQAMNETLSKKKVNDELIRKIAARLAFENNADIFLKEGINSENLSSRGKNIYNNIMTNIESGVGQSDFKNHNGLWLFNGISTYFQNGKEYNTHGSKDDTKKFDNLMGGTAHKKMMQAYNEIIAA